ncbi:MAG: hypothetical protein EXS13_07430 [Planctomycetes bacterium]|nr:hypothetical protein [Planctomycetota bacterium]
MSRLSQFVERRFFAAAPVRDLAILRLLVVGTLLFVMLFPYALFTFPVWGRLDLLAALPDSQWEPVPIVRLLLLPFCDGFRPPLAAMEWVLRASICAGAFALAGLFTRTTLLLFALGNLLISGYGYSYHEHHHIEALTVLALLALAAAPSGDALALDAWLARRRGSPPAAASELARWPLELMQWLFALCYLSAAVCKLGASGWQWLNGYTLQGYLLQEGVFWGTSSSVWLARHHGLCVVLSWGALLVELLFPLVLWQRRLALLFVPAAAAIHLGIWVTMRAPFWLYLPLYAVFVPWSRLFNAAPEIARAQSGFRRTGPRLQEGGE